MLAHSFHPTAPVLLSFQLPPSLILYQPRRDKKQIYVIHKHFCRAYSLQGTVLSTLCILTPN